MALGFTMDAAVAATCWIMLCCSVSPAAAGDEGDATQAVLESLGNAYLANRESFTAISCSGDVSEGYAATREDAIEGAFQPDVRYRFQWSCFDGVILHKVIHVDESAFEERVIRAEAAARKVGALDFSLPYLPDQVLTGANGTVHYGGVLKNANVYDGSRGLLRTEFSPFSLGMMGEDDQFNPGHMLLQASRGEFWWKLHDSPPEQGGIFVVSVGESEDRIYYKYWIDPRRGFLPQRMETRNTLVIFDEIRAVEGDRYIPTRSLKISPKNGSGRVRVVRTEIQELLVDQPPPPGTFVLTLPEGTSIVPIVEDPEARGFKLEAAEQVSLADIPRLIERSKQTPVSPTAHDEAMPPKRSSWFITLIVVNMVGLACLVLLMLRRRTLKGRDHRR